VGIRGGQEEQKNKTKYIRGTKGKENPSIPQAIRKLRSSALQAYLNPLNQLMITLHIPAERACQAKQLLEIPSRHPCAARRCSNSASQPATFLDGVHRPISDHEDDA